MTSYYLDSSALGKRYVQETGTDWVRMLIDPKADHTLLTARITMVEIYSALARRKREGSVPAADCDTASRAFTAHSATDYDFVELDLTTVNLSRNLLNRHPLRAYDAVQLASALMANQVLQSANLSPLVFVSADNRLNDAALAEGLTVDNPNLHL
jgi:predicted nucleic acid-binding protein